jgi:putative endopeptidase
MTGQERVNFARAIKRFVKKGLRESPTVTTGAQGHLSGSGAPHGRPLGGIFLMAKARIALISALLLTGTAPLVAQTGGAPAAKAPAPRPPAASRYGRWGVDLDARDPAIKPGDDFWRYANGRWFAANPIPADRTAWGVGTVLSEDVEAQLRAIVESANRGTDPVSRQVAAMYASWMDEAGIEARGAAVLTPYLDRIAAVRNRDDLITLFATPGYPAPIGVGITPNPADPTRYVAGTAQGGLGMPNRDYYLREGAPFDGYRAGYRSYVTTMLRLAGIADPETKADAIIALERRRSSTGRCCCAPRAWATSRP